MSDAEGPRHNGVHAGGRDEPQCFAFSTAEREAFYRLVLARRDIRRFHSEPIPEAVLQRMLWAAHHAGSVGYMQPWDFILIRSLEIRSLVKALFTESNEAASKAYSGERRQLYDSLKLEGILESPLNLCVTCDTRRGGDAVLGRHSTPETDLYSTCLAIQNLWLAARAEGVGVGWVSILDNQRLAEILDLPKGVVPVAYLCAGYPVAFPPIPELEAVGWGSRLTLDSLLHYDTWADLSPRTNREP